MADVGTVRSAPASRDHLVILVHGVNTRALWMGEVKPALEQAGFAVGLTSYGKFGLLRFLSPLRWMRGEAIRRVVSDIKTAKRSHRIRTGSEPRYMSLIAHSFGTYVVGRILTDYPEFQWRRIIFCGSVVREDFPFDKIEVLERFDHPLVNEVATRDYWPALAESAGWGYGSVGSTGFNRPPVETRWHKGYRHSDFLTETFCNQYWIPFLRGDDPKHADRPSSLPFWIRVITLFPLRWILVATIVVPIVGTISWVGFHLRNTVDIATILAGNYQVHLGPGGGCNRGPPNTIPSTLARIERNEETLMAHNECGETSQLNIVDFPHAFWWNQPVTISISGKSVVISEDRPGGNSWQKVQ